MADDRTRPPTSPDDESDVYGHRCLAVVFGDVLVETTQDEGDPEPPSEEDDARDRWLRGQVPPHHG